ETYRSRNTEVDTAKGKKNDAAHQRKGHIHQHQAGIVGVAKSEKENREDDDDGNRENHVEPLARAFQILELAAPAHLIPRRQLHRLAEPLLRVSHEAALIAAANVGADGYDPLVGPPGDDAAPIDYFDLCKLRQWHPSRVAGGNENAADGRGVGAGFRHIAYGDVEATLAFKH